ncbi:MAG TPA: tetratricopeptide repeat protein [Deltaproteobacteria bacterium]|nr:tetratricopeptide repeat protein [Deltaproteobacteria bacterium]
MRRRYLYNFYIALALLVPCCALLGCAHLSPDVPVIEQEKSKTNRADSYYHYMKGVLHSLHDETDKAVNEYTRALGVHPCSPYLAMELASSHLQKNDIDGAVAILEASVRQNPDHVDTHILLGTFYERMQEHDKAVRHYRTAIELEPELPDPYLLLSTVYRNQKNYDAARSVLEELLCINFDNAMAAYQLAHVYLEMRNLDKAKYWLRRTLTLEPGFSSAMKDLAVIFEHEQDLEEAVSLYRQYLDFIPRDMAARARLGNLLLNRGLYREAAAEFETILDQGSYGVDIRLSLGLAYLFGEINLEKSTEIFRDLVNENPDDERARYFLAVSYQEQGEKELALEEFGRITPSSSVFAPSRIQMSLILNLEGKTAEAVRIIDKAIVAKNDEPDLYLVLASLHEDTGDIDRSEKILRMGLAILPESTDIIYRLGLIYEKRRQFDKAIDLMRDILAIDPENAEALNFIGYSYADRGINLDEAETMILKALQLKPGSGHIIDSLGWVYFRQNRIAEALEQLEKAREFLPDDPTVAQHLGDVYELNGRYEEALEIYRKALDHTPDDSEIKRKIENLKKMMP